MHINQKSATLSCLIFGAQTYAWSASFRLLRLHRLPRMEATKIDSSAARFLQKVSTMNGLVRCPAIRNPLRAYSAPHMWRWPFPWQIAHSSGVPSQRKMETKGAHCYRWSVLHFYFSWHGGLSLKHFCQSRSAEVTRAYNCLVGPWIANTLRLGSCADRSGPVVGPLTHGSTCCYVTDWRLAKYLRLSCKLEMWLPSGNWENTDRELSAESAI